MIPPTSTIASRLAYELEFSATWKKIRMGKAIFDTPWCKLSIALWRDFKLSISSFSHQISIKGSCSRRFSSHKVVYQKMLPIKSNEFLTFLWVINETNNTSVRWCECLLSRLFCECIFLRLVRYLAWYITKISSVLLDLGKNELSCGDQTNRQMNSHPLHRISLSNIHHCNIEFIMFVDIYNPLWCLAICFKQ